MRKTLLFSALLLGGAYFTDAAAAVIEPVAVEQSGCKFRTRAQEETPEWDTLMLENGVLTVTIHDLSTNCAARLTVNAEIRDDQLRFTATILPQEDWATCVCPYDVSGSFEGIGEGEYDVDLIFDNTYYSEVWNLGHYHVQIEEGKPVILRYSSLPGLSAFTKSASRISSEGILTVDHEGLCAVAVYQTNGVSVLNLELEGPGEISLRELKPGTYVVRLTGKDMDQTLRFVR